MAKKSVKIPAGYGAKVYAKKGATAGGKKSYIKFIAECRKSGKDLKTCAAEWKKMKKGGAQVYAKKSRRRAARVVRRKRKLPAGYGYASV